MKITIFFIFLLFFTYFFTSCHKDDVNKITFQNNSTRTIKLMFSTEYPDTSFVSIEDCSCGTVLPATKCDCKSNFAWNDANSSNILIFYIWDRDTINKYGFYHCLITERILRKYQYSVDELKNMNWTFSYP
jgi:hypothetical protein